MKVFLSWSGELSREVALKLNWWLPKVIQTLEPYISSEDIETGQRWSDSIATELERASVGIICVTRSNVNKPWINFEAGALSKSVDTSRVIPFLFNMKKSELKGPLLQFQAVTFTKDDVFKILDTLNKACEKGLDAADLVEIFDVWWPRLENALNSPSVHTEDVIGDAPPAPRVPESEVLEEILDLVRGQQKILGSPENFLPKPLVQYLGSELQHGNVVITSYATIDRLIRGFGLFIQSIAKEGDRLEYKDIQWDGLSLAFISIQELSSQSGIRSSSLDIDTFFRRNPWRVTSSIRNSPTIKNTIPKQSVEDIFAKDDGSMDDVPF